jgi:hypothetical protein
MKVVINSCYGGFSLSKEAYDFIGINWDGYGFRFSNDRTNDALIRCVEELGDKASGIHSKLKVITIPDDIEWFIDEYDGLESVHEDHRVWD